VEGHECECALELAQESAAGAHHRDAHHASQYNKASRVLALMLSTGKDQHTSSKGGQLTLPSRKKLLTDDGFTTSPKGHGIQTLLPLKSTEYCW